MIDACTDDGRAADEVRHAVGEPLRQWKRGHSHAALLTALQAAHRHTGAPGHATLMRVQGLTAGRLGD